MTRSDRGFGHYQVTLAADASNLYVGSSGRVGRIALSDFESLSWSRQLEDSGATVDVLLRGATLYAGINGQIFRLDAHSGNKLGAIALTGQDRRPATTASSCCAPAGRRFAPLTASISIEG